MYFQDDIFHSSVDLTFVTINHPVSVLRFILLLVYVSQDTVVTVM